MTKKTIKRANADVRLIFTAFNLRRIFNLIVQNLLKQYLRVLVLFFVEYRKLFKAFYRSILFEKQSSLLQTIFLLVRQIEYIYQITSAF
jgi:hypothetical protein